VTVITGASEIGQGSETVLAQLVGEELGLPMDAVRVVNSDTDITPWDVGVHASRTTFIAGNAALGAAKKAKSRYSMQRRPSSAARPRNWICAAATSSVRPAARRSSNYPNSSARCISQKGPSL